MADISMKELLEAGVHFGHQTRRWNPKMKKYIFGSRNGIYIIDLQKTMKLFRETSEFVSAIAAKGKKVLFVGTKRQAQEAIEGVGEFDIPYVSQRWLGGTLTNFHTIKKSIDKLKRLDEMLEHEDLDDLTKKERYGLERERNKLLKLFKGIRELNGLPDALFVIDPKREKIAVQEARIMNIPVIAIVDTNCDPDVIDYVIPGNDDAIRAINLFVSKMVQSIQEGRQMVGADVHPQDQAEAELEAEAEEPAATKPEAGKPEPKKAVPAAPKEEAPKKETAKKEAPEKEAKPAAKPEAKPAAKAEPKVESKTEAKSEAEEEKKPAAKPEKKAEVKKEEKAEAKAEPKKEKAEKKAEEPKKAEKADKAKKAEKVEKPEEKPKAKATAKKTTAKKSTTKKATKDTGEKPKAAAKKTTKKKADAGEDKAEKKTKTTTKAKAAKKTDSEPEKKADTGKKKSATAKKED